jgi:hypothetical protein
MLSSPEQGTVCARMNTARSGRADRAPGRCRAGEGFAWPQDLTGRFIWGLLVGDAQVPTANHRSLLFGQDFLRLATVDL